MNVVKVKISKIMIMAALFLYGCKVGTEKDNNFEIREAAPVMKEIKLGMSQIEVKEILKNNGWVPAPLRLLPGYNSDTKLGRIFCIYSQIQKRRKRSYLSIAFEQVPEQPIQDMDKYEVTCFVITKSIPESKDMPQEFKDEYNKIKNRRFFY